MTKTDHNQPPIVITPDQSARLDKLADEFNYGQARKFMGFVPLSRTIEVRPETEMTPQSAPPDLPEGTVLGHWKNDA